ncbi:multidrug resistance-associated protein 4-like [Patiria miniata]|uniref:Cystic fibrosis transmembrane conductance regulator n=1 Tax=Patiria miniata TaxID=46514 RepID=A0A913ZHB1_PATMI|nr:multidrug resistance-associated protein 4-like [Patiria miniata]
MAANEVNGSCKTSGLPDHVADTKQTETSEPAAKAPSVDRRPPHPMKTAGLFSKLFFIWMFDFFRRGYKRPLVETDLYDVLPDDSADVVVGKLEREWNKEIDKSKVTGRPPSLRWALVRAFGWYYMKQGFPAFIEEVILKMAQPVMLTRLVLYFSTDTVSTTEAYLQAVGLSLTALFMLITHHACFFGFNITGMRLRTACSGLIFRKSLRLSNLALGETTIGQLVNILSNDVNRFDLAFQFLHYLWIAPFQLIAVIALAWREIGVSCLAGISVLIFTAPLQGYMGKLFSKLRAKTALLSDTRIRIMNEVISGIRVIKIYAWEHSFGNLVAESRRKEARKILHSAYLRGLILALLFSGPLLTTFITFVVYASLGNPVTPSKVFPILALFYSARICLSVFFPYAVMNGSEGLVSIRRIQKFLLMEELQIHTKERDNNASGDVALEEPVILLDEIKADGIPQNDESNISEHPDRTRTKSTNCLIESAGNGELAGYEGPAGSKKEEEPNEPNLDLKEPDTEEEDGAKIVVENMYGSWNKDVNNTVLQDVSFRVEPGELLAVIGPVGCGKSSLLMALLGELPTVSGVNILSGQVGYTAQQPWILSGSLRDNILFGSEYEPAKYQRIIKQCALTRDIELLPDGDLTLVGERGVTLSGGQRARVSLARAMYSDADVYLLDDPLSAVDPAVGRHLFEKCILHQMKDKAVILVTHQLQFLDKADKILILKEGREAGYGTYQELQEHGVDFASLLKKKTKDGDYDGANEQDVNPETLDDKVSMSSDVSFYPDRDEVETPVDIVPEEMAVGIVEWTVYIRYFRAAAGVLFLIFWAIVVISAQALFSCTDVWLATWANEEEKDLVDRNITSQDYQDGTEYANRSYYIRIYAILLGATTAAMFLRAFLFFYMFVTASKALHNQMFGSIIRAPMQFFDTNPVGRILNRFAKDIGYMDEILPATFTDFLQISLITTAIVVLVSIFNPFCLTFILPIVIVFYFTRKYYLASSRDVKRLEGIARSPIFSHLSATLTGLSTVRAFKVQQRFTADFEGYLDGHTRAWFCFQATSRWFGVQMDFFSVLFIAGVSFACILAADLLDLNSGIVGLSLTYSMTLMGTFQWAVRQSAELENQMTSVERVCEYIDIKPEAPLETDHKPPPDWPQEGGITLQDASLRYSEDGPLVLQDISCAISPKEKVGIVGRTGAGKSSLMTVLMRLAEPTGTIMIDGINTALIGLHDLRKKVSFIPQDPVLFSGSLRKNLDPFSAHSDSDIWRAIEEVELKPAIEELPDKLEALLTEGGTNFSVGQRQLLCLARAILRKNKILIVDEATANVDIRTDRLIQATIRQRFKHCTVLTIAHRLNTIMDSDKVMVLDAGRLIEFDEPYVLLQKEDGIFSKMVQETGKAETAKLLQIADEKYHLTDGNEPEDIDKPVYL